MVGLWFAKRWAEHLMFVATTVLVPIEIYELTLGVSAFKVITFIINVAIVVYLLLAKRLFGLRGGHRVVLERRRQFSGWPVIDRTTRPNRQLPRPHRREAPGASSVEDSDDPTAASGRGAGGWYRACRTGRWRSW